MKKVIAIFTVFVSLFMWSCGNSNSNPKEGQKTEKQTITQDIIIGEWECVDITNGVIHMKDIAQMQPHMVFTNDGKIINKMVLSDGSIIKQKLANYKIENGQINSKVFEGNAYMESGKLIFEDPSADNKSIYKKIEE
ncbi:MAG: hypothetical protein U9R42_11210 [Bacteroidota bacterium]|nr:hypothetical protein [Bacteroidota bacterium]